MTPGAGTAQAVSTFLPDAQRLWRCVVVAAGRSGAIHDARCRNGTSSQPHSARRPTLWRCAVAAAARRGTIHDARCRDGTSSPPRSCPAPSVYGNAQLPQQHVGAPFMTPGAGTAQAVRRIPPGAQRLWQCAVVAAARRGAIHDARYRDGTNSPPHSARRPAFMAVRSCRRST